MAKVLTDFKVVPVKGAIGPSYLTVTQKALKFNADTYALLGSPSYIRFLVKEATSQVAIQPCDFDEKTSIPFPYTKGKRAHPIAVREIAFLTAVSKLLPLMNDGKPVTYKVKGEYFPEENVLVYDLKDAREYSPHSSRKDL